MIHLRLYQYHDSDDAMDIIEKLHYLSLSEMQTMNRVLHAVITY